MGAWEAVSVKGWVFRADRTKQHLQKDEGIPFPCSDYPTSPRHNPPPCILICPVAAFWTMKAFAAVCLRAIWLRLPLRGQGFGQLAADWLYYQSATACQDELHLQSLGSWLPVCAQIALRMERL